MHGPIDYIVVGFDGPKFDGSILKELAAAIDAGTIALVALSVLSKDVDGNVTTLDISTLGEEAVQFDVKYHPDNDLIDQDDIDEVAELLEPNTAAGLLVVEHLWAKPLKKSIINAGGFLVAEGRIHPEAALELDKEV